MDGLCKHHVGGKNECHCGKKGYVQFLLLPDDCISCITVWQNLIKRGRKKYIYDSSDEARKEINTSA